MISYTGHERGGAMMFERFHWWPQTVYQTEKPGAPESETKRKQTSKLGRGMEMVGVGGKKKLMHQGP